MRQTFWPHSSLAPQSLSSRHCPALIAFSVSVLPKRVSFSAVVLFAASYQRDVSPNGRMRRRILPKLFTAFHVPFSERRHGDVTQRALPPASTDAEYLPFLSSVRRAKPENAALCV